MYRRVCLLKILTFENRKTSIIQASQASLIALVRATQYGIEPKPWRPAIAGAWRGGSGPAGPAFSRSAPWHTYRRNPTPRRAAPRRTRGSAAIHLLVPTRSCSKPRLPPRRAFRHRLCLFFVFRVFFSILLFTGRTVIDEQQRYCSVENWNLLS